MTYIPDNLDLIRDLNPGEIARLRLGSVGGQLLYLFFHNRSPEQGGIWAGLETYAPTGGPDAATGYGALPLRIWGKHVLLEAGGEIVCRQVYTPGVILQTPLDHPPRGAGIYPDWNAQTVQVTHRDGELVFYDKNHPNGITLSEVKKP